MNILMMLYTHSLRAGSKLQTWQYSVLLQMAAHSSVVLTWKTTRVLLSEEKALMEDRYITKLYVTLTLTNISHKLENLEAYD